MSLFPRDISIPMQLGTPNVTQKCFKISPGSPFILGLKGQRSRPQVTKTLPAWVFALWWMLASSSFCHVFVCIALFELFILLYLRNIYLCFMANKDFYYFILWYSLLSPNQIRNRIPDSGGCKSMPLWLVQLPTPLVFIGCLLSDPIFLPKRRIICRPIFEQINTYYTAEYFTECILLIIQLVKRNVRVWRWGSL